MLTRERSSSRPMDGGPLTVILDILRKLSLFVSLPELCEMPRKSHTTPSSARVWLSSHSGFFSVSKRPPRHCRHLLSPDFDSTVVCEHSLHWIGLIPLICCDRRWEKERHRYSSRMSIRFWHACVPCERPLVASSLGLELTHRSRLLHRPRSSVGVLDDYAAVEFEKSWTVSFLFIINKVYRFSK